jgi:hypothetical protein
MKTQGEGMHTKRGSGETDNEATDLVIESPILDQEAIARMAYFCWEARGCPNDSPDEDWFRAEAELRNRSLPPQRPEELRYVYGVGRAADGGHSQFGGKFLTGIAGVAEALLVQGVQGCR